MSMSFRARTKLRRRLFDLCKKKHFFLMHFRFFYFALPKLNEREPRDKKRSPAVSPFSLIREMAVQPSSSHYRKVSARKTFLWWCYVAPLSILGALFPCTNSLKKEAEKMPNVGHTLKMCSSASITSVEPFSFPPSLLSLSPSLCSS